MLRDELLEMRALLSACDSDKADLPLPCGGSRAYVCVRFFLRILQLGKKHSIIYVVQSKRQFQRFDSSLELSIQIIEFIQHAIAHCLAHQSYY